MKILPIPKVREADAYTIKHEPIPDIDLMERAANELYEWIAANTPPDQPIRIFCGMGNNGGDGFVLGRLLAGKKYTVDLYVVRHSEKMSPSCKVNYERAKKITGLSITDVQNESGIPEIPNDCLVVDAIFGSGLTRPVKGLAGSIVDVINTSDAVIIAVDAPTGLYCDQSNIDNDGSIVEADYTLTFQFPKLGFLFPENEKYVGKWEVLPIGLHPDFIKSVDVKDHYLTSADLRPLLKKRSVFSHKGTYGHGLLIAGGYGKMGAAVLAAKAGMKAGAGLITAHIPSSGNGILQTAVPIAMVSLDEDTKILTRVPDLSPYSAVAIGPGLGQERPTQNALKLFIQNSGGPIIFDADALNMLSENKTWISFIPKNSILTPHPKEFERLAGSSRDHFERNEMQRAFSVKYGVYVILKGAHTCVSTPKGICYFNSTGNPGMATGGSGDVLTGILLGLAAQGYSSMETSLAGVYIHGLAGDIASEKWGYEALTANNITHSLGKAFRRLKH